MLRIGLLPKQLLPKMRTQSFVRDERDNQHESQGAVKRRDSVRAAALTDGDSCTVPLDRSQTLDLRAFVRGKPASVPALLAICPKSSR